MSLFLIWRSGTCCRLSVFFSLLFRRRATAPSVAVAYVASDVAELGVVEPDAMDQDNGERGRMSPAVPAAGDGAAAPAAATVPAAAVLLDGVDLEGMDHDHIMERGSRKRVASKGDSSTSSSQHGSGRSGNNEDDHRSTSTSSSHGSQRSGNSRGDDDGDSSSSSSSHGSSSSRRTSESGVSVSSGDAEYPESSSSDDSDEREAAALIPEPAGAAVVAALIPEPALPDLPVDPSRFPDLTKVSNHFHRIKEPRAFARLAVIDKKMPLVLPTATLADQLGLSREGLTTVDKYIKGRLSLAVSALSIAVRDEISGEAVSTGGGRSTLITSLRPLERHQLGELTAEMIQRAGGVIVSSSLSSVSSKKVLQRHVPRACDRKQDGDFYERKYYVSNATIQVRLAKDPPLETQRFLDFRGTNIVAAAVDTLFDPETLKDEANYQWKYSPEFDGDSGERVYSELGTAGRWQEAEVHLRGCVYYHSHPSPLYTSFLLRLLCRSILAQTGRGSIMASCP